MGAILLLAIGIFFAGMLAFVLLGEEKYFIRYVVLEGHYLIINVMFLLDYSAMALGAMGIPSLIAGCICKAVGKKQILYVTSAIRLDGAFISGKRKRIVLQPLDPQWFSFFMTKYLFRKM